MTLGEKIQTLRKQSGMSQEELAAKITITRQAISRWEQNESIPDVDNLIQLSRIFGVSTDFLLKGTEFPEQQPHGKTKKTAHSMWIYRKLFNNGTIHILGVTVFLVIGVFFHRWHPTWAIMPLLGLLHGAIEAWVDDDDD